jgi:hypothetical protein
MEIEDERGCLGAFSMSGVRVRNASRKIHLISPGDYADLPTPKIAAATCSLPNLPRRSAPEQAALMFVSQFDRCCDILR